MTRTTTTTSKLRRFATGISIPLIVWGASACAAHHGPASAAAPRSSVHEGPLTDFVPAAGLRLLVVAEPERLAHDAALSRAIELLLPSPRIAAFALSTGLDLRDVPVALVASFDYSTLYAAQFPGDASLIESRFVDRLAGSARRTDDSADVRRISGAVSTIPQTLVTVKERLVAVSVGDPTPARVVALYAGERLGHSPTALRGAALSTLPANLETAPLRLYAPGPFAGEWAAGARGLLGAATALGVSVRPSGDALDVFVVVTGHFDATDAERLGSAFSDLAESSMGKLLGLDEPVKAPATRVIPEGVALDVSLRTVSVASGLRAAVAADVWEILDVRNPKVAPSPTPAPPP